jgi:hypothetical protein
MRRIKTTAGCLMLLVGLAIPQSSCQGCNALLGVALSLGLAVGGYFLAKAITG